jgi:hypothetical protein
MVSRSSLVVKDQSGYIALLGVLIVGAAALAISLVLLTTSTDSQRAVLVAQQSKQARALVVACGQEALQVIHDDTAYTGTDNLSLGQGTCGYTVTSTGASTRTITVTASVMNITRKAQIYVTIGPLNISITSWQETS